MLRSHRFTMLHLFLNFLVKLKSLNVLKNSYLQLMMKHVWICHARMRLQYYSNNSHVANVNDTYSQRVILIGSQLMSSNANYIKPNITL